MGALQIYLTRVSLGAPARPGAIGGDLGPLQSGDTVGVPGRAVPREVAESQFLFEAWTSPSVPG